MLNDTQRQIRVFPPYTRRRAIKLLADFEIAVRDHEMMGSKHPLDQDAILERYEHQRKTMLQRLTGTKE